MVGAYSVGDWIGGRFQVFDVHEGGMSLVYVVNDQMGGLGPAGGCAQDAAQRTLGQSYPDQPVCRRMSALGATR